VIVLPFENTSGEPSQDNLATRITRDVTNSVAQDATIPIVPEQTAIAYRNKPLDLHLIRQEHNVHFAVAGGVRRDNGRLIVTVTVFDTKDDRPVWSQQYNRDDRPEVYDQIIHSITSGFDQTSIDAEAAHAKQEHPNDMDKRDLMIASTVSSLGPTSKEHYLARMALVDRALALDPNYVWALQSSARLAADLVLLGYSIDPKADLARALTRVNRALELAPSNFETLKEESRVLRAQGDLDGAAAVIHKLLEMNPLSAYRYVDLGVVRLLQGHPDEMLTNMETAKRLATISDDAVSIDALLAVGLLANGRFADAIPQARLASAQFPKESGRIGEYPWLALIAAEYLIGDDQQAKADLQHFLATPRTLSNLAAVQATPTLAHTPGLIDALRHAGMPEQ
jgi:adenylate cyclase